MKIFQTEGLFLRSFPLSESDKVVACLTPDFGLIRLVAKGSRKLKSRFSGTLEPFSIAQIDFYRREDGDLGILRQVELRHSYFHLAKKINVVAALAYFGELLTNFAPPHEPNQVLYRMSRSCFEAVSEVADNLEKVAVGVLYFEMWILRLNGYLPDIRTCGECRKNIKSQETVIWSPENRFLCKNCGDRRGLILDGEQNRIVRAARSLSPSDFIQQITAKREILNPLTLISRKLIKQVLLRELDYWSEKNWESV